MKVADCYRCGCQPAVELELDGHGATVVRSIYCGGCDTGAEDAEAWNWRQVERKAEDDATTPEHDS